MRATFGANFAEIVAQASAPSAVDAAVSGYTILIGVRSAY